MNDLVRILLVEDNPGDADLLCDLLPEQGAVRFRLDWVQRMAEAVARLERGNADIVVLDLGLPDSSGLDSLRTVRNAAPTVPVVVLTGNDDELAGIRAVKAGAQDYLIKGQVSGLLLARILTHALERHRTQTQLEESERFLRATLDGLSANIAIVGEDGTILAVNKAWMDFAIDNGADLTKVGVGANYLAVCERAEGGDGPVASAFAEGIRTVLAGSSNRFERDYPCHGPEAQRWFCGRITPFSGPGPRRVVAAHEAITARKQAEEALRESEERFRLVFDTSPNCVFIKDGQGRYLMVNQTIADLFGTSKTEMLGKVDDDFAAIGRLGAEEARHFHAEDIKVITRRTKRVAAEERFTRADGTVSWFHTIKTPLPLPSDPNCMLGISVDITRQKIAQQALTDSELRMRTILDAQENHLVLQDLSQAIIWPNQAACTTAGLTREVLIGRRCHEVWHDRNSACPDCPVVVAIETGKPCSCIHTRPDGRIWRVTGSPVMDASGRIIHALEVAEDITERRTLEDQLRHSQKMESIGVLAGGIAHDFNNILSAIIGYTDLALLAEGLTSTLKEDLDEVSRAGHRAKQLVAQILAFSRQMKSEMAPVQVHLIIKEAVKLLKATLPATIVVRENIRSFAEVMADPSQIHQVMMNLCTNAYHAMREMGGVLEVELEKVELDAMDIDPTQPVEPGSFLCLGVRDTGCGMDDTVRKRIFDPYFTTKTKGEGTGLGLAVVYGIVQTHGGMITVISEPGKGSTFRVFLPQLVTGKAREIDESLTEALPTGKERILMVDDEPPICKVTRRILEPLGYRVTTFSDPREALVQFRRDSDGFDLVITDMTMPGMTGDVLAKEMIRLRSDLPVIVCTGFSEKIDAQRAEAVGIRALVNKPFDRSELALKVREVLDGH